MSSNKGWTAPSVWFPSKNTVRRNTYGNTNLRERREGQVAVRLTRTRRTSGMTRINREHLASSWVPSALSPLVVQMVEARCRCLQNTRY